MLVHLVVAAVAACVVASAEITPAPTDPALPPLRALCERFHGFAGEPDSVFTVKFKGSLSPDEALVFVADALSPTAPLQLNVTLPLVGRPAQSFTSADGFVALSSALVNGKKLRVDVEPVATADTGFIFYSFVANYPTCAVSFGASRPISGPLPIVSDKPAVMYLTTDPAVTPQQFVLKVSATEKVEATYTTNLDFVTGSVPFSVDAPAQGTLDAGAALFVTLRPAAATAGRFTMSAAFAAAPTLSPASPALPVVSPAEPASGWGGAVASVLLNLLIFGVAGYFVLRSAYNYRRGVTQWPEFVPHHEVFSAAWASAARLAEEARRRVTGGSIGIRTTAGGIPMPTMRGEYNPVSATEA